jgi:hypothetical protein
LIAGFGQLLPDDHSMKQPVKRPLYFKTCRMAKST